MTARRGWCPSVFDPMPAGDGLLVRIKPPGGTICADAARVLAEAAARHGNGIIELTGRGNLQVRGLSPANVASFAAAMVACGLAGADAERRRNVTVSPLAGDDPSVAPETAAIAAAIERGLASPCFAALPAKFGFLVDGGGVLALDGVAADIFVRAEGSGFAVSVAPAQPSPASGGGQGRGRFHGGSELALAVAEQAAEGALRLARAFLDLSATVPTAPRRMRDLVPSPNPLPQGEGAIASLPLPLREGAGGRGTARQGPPNPIGFLRYPRLDRGAFGLGLPFGHVQAATLAMLADLAVRFGDGKLRTTPWRAVLFGSVEEADAAELTTLAQRAGLIVDPADARRKIVACAGHPACASASVATRSDAALLASMSSGFVHVSGCSKGCAHPRPASVTLVGADGRYGLVRNGTAADPPDIAGLTIAEAADLLESGIAA